MSIGIKIKNIGIRIKQNIDIRAKNLKGASNPKSDEIIILNTAMGSDNLGDEIIMYYYSKAMEGIISPQNLYNIATHKKISDTDVERLLNCKYAVIIGTNILSPQMELYSGWKFDNRLIRMRNVVLVGVGWWGYKKPSIYSKYVYKNILSKNVIHSVRDEQTYRILKSITAIVNTILNVILVFLIGPLGAAISTAFAYFLMWAIRLNQIKKCINLRVNLVRDLTAYIILVIQAILLLVIQSDSVFCWYQLIFVLITLLLYIKELKSVFMKFVSKIK